MKCCSSSHDPPDTACKTFERGMCGNCVFCDHEEKCHPGPGGRCMVFQDDLDPPFPLPMREPLPERRHDPNPDDTYSGQYVTAKDLQECVTIELSLAQITLINEQQRKAEAFVRKAVVETFGVAKEPHNAETCRDPARDCFPF